MEIVRPITPFSLLTVSSTSLDDHKIFPLVHDSVLAAYLVTLHCSLFVLITEYHPNVEVFVVINFTIDVIKTKSFYYLTAKKKEEEFKN